MTTRQPTCDASLWREGITGYLCIREPGHFPATPHALSDEFSWTDPFCGYEVEPGRPCIRIDEHSHAVVAEPDWAAARAKRELIEQKFFAAEAAHGRTALTRDFGEVLAQARALDTALSSATVEIMRLRAALNQIANTDYRGHRSPESAFAAAVLGTEPVGPES